MGSAGGGRGRGWWGSRGQRQSSGTREPPPSAVSLWAPRLRLIPNASFPFLVLTRAKRRAPERRKDRSSPQIPAETPQDDIPGACPWVASPPLPHGRSRQRGRGRGLRWRGAPTPPGAGSSLGRSQCPAAAPLPPCAVSVGRRCFGERGFRALPKRASRTCYGGSRPQSRGKATCFSGAVPPVLAICSPYPPPRTEFAGDCSPGYRVTLSTYVQGHRYSTRQSPCLPGQTPGTSA